MEASMSTSLVGLVYGSAVVLALVLLYFFHTHWIWHVLSVVAALGFGMAPPDFIPLPTAWGASRDLVIGFVFLFLITWGLGAPLFHHHHAPHAPKQA
jgi:hypothetical protein